MAAGEGVARTVGHVRNLFCAPLRNVLIERACVLEHCASEHHVSSTPTRTMSWLAVVALSARTHFSWIPLPAPPHDYFKVEVRLVDAIGY